MNVRFTCPFFLLVGNGMEEAMIKSGRKRGRVFQFLMAILHSKLDILVEMSGMNIVVSFE